MKTGPLKQIVDSIITMLDITQYYKSTVFVDENIFPDSIKNLLWNLE